ncbi:unnamed protein product [Chrysoparadoxa australica]
MSIGKSSGKSFGSGFGSRAGKGFNPFLSKGNKNNYGGGLGGNGGGINNNGPKFTGMGEQDDDPLSHILAAGVLTDIWDQYNQVLEEKPILTKACTSLVGFSIGDILAQKFVASGDSFDCQRLCRMAAFGFLFHGTISHFFYNKLDEVLPGVEALTVIKKVFIDQVLWAPIFTFIYLTWIGVTSGHSPSQISDKIKNDLIKGVVGSWTVWPLAHTINFRFIPTEQRLLYINSIQIGYNVFLSVLGAAKK